MIRVMLLEDHLMVRNAFSRLINSQPDMEVVAEATTAEELWGTVRQARPDVVSIDLEVPGASGREVALRLLEELPDTALLICTCRSEPNEVQMLVESGVHGYISKSAGADEYLQALRVVARGHHHLSKEAAAALATAVRSREPGPENPLTSRQREVMLRIARGLTTREIADDMCLSPKTIEKYRSGILKRLDSKNLFQALETARRRNLI